MTENDSFLRFFQILNERDLETAETLLDPRAELFFPKTKPIIGYKESPYNILLEKEITIESL